MGKNLNTLKDYLEYYKTVCNEIEIVEKYIQDKNLNKEYTEMVIRLTARQLANEKSKFAQAEFIMTSCFEDYHPNYTKEETQFLTQLLHIYAFYGEFGETTLEKAKQYIPNMLMPTWYYRDVIALLNKHGIMFKDQKEKMDFIRG